MKVLQAMAGGEVGGAEAFFVRLAGALVRAGIDQSVTPVSVTETALASTSASSSAGMTRAPRRFAMPGSIRSNSPLAACSTARQPGVSPPRSGLSHPKSFCRG